MAKQSHLRQQSPRYIALHNAKDVVRVSLGSCGLGRKAGQSDQYNLGGPKDDQDRVASMSTRLRWLSPNARGVHQVALHPIPLAVLPPPSSYADQRPVPFTNPGVLPNATGRYCTRLVDHFCRCKAVLLVAPRHDGKPA